MKFSITRKDLPLASFESGGLSIEHGICLLFQTRSSRTASCLLVFIFLPPLQAFPRIGGKHAIHESWRQARSPKGDDGNERRPRAGSDGKENERERAFSPLPITPFVQAFLNN